MTDENEGYLAGEIPDGRTTLFGSAVEANIRIAWRSLSEDVGDGLIVARTQSSVNGEWRVTGLDIRELYDVIGSLDGYEDKIVSLVQPVPIYWGFVDDGIYPNETFTGVNGHLTVIGGLPPYTFELIDAEPSGLTVNFNGRFVSVSGEAEDLPDGAHYIRAKATASNGIEILFEIPIYIGFNAPSVFGAQKAPLFRPTWFKNQKLGLFRPTWLKVKALELD